MFYRILGRISSTVLVTLVLVTTQALAKGPSAVEAEAARIEAERILEAQKKIEAKAKEIEAKTLQITAASTEDARQQLTSEKEVLEKELEALTADAKAQTSERTRREILQEQADTRFAGFGFGLALAVTIDIGDRDRIEDAQLVGSPGSQVVRVNKDNNTRANFMLESHYFFEPDWRFLSAVEPGNWGWGPFVAAQPGSSDIIDSVGAGVMLGFRRRVVVSSIAPNAGDSFNLGIGFILDPNTKVLGDGIVANEALPTGETEIRFKNTTQTGVLATFSYSF